MRSVKYRLGVCNPKPQPAQAAVRMALPFCCCLHLISYLTECTLNHLPFMASQVSGVLSQQHDGKRGQEVGADRRVRGCYG